MKKIIALSFVLLVSVFFFSACDNSIVSSLISGDYSGGGGGSYISGDLTGMNELEIEIVKEINKVRSDPRGWMIRHKANGGEMWSGAHTMDRDPVPQLSVTKGMSRASIEHANTQTNSHTWSYVNTYVNWGSAIGQNMGGNFIIEQGQRRMAQAGYYDATPAEAIVYEFIRDSGNSDKGHRENIMDPRWRVVGVGYRSQGCVMNFAVSATDK